MSIKQNPEIKIIPTLLTHSFKEFKEKLEKVRDYFDLVQIDCMDNKFVSNKTFYDLNKIKEIKWYKGDYELHLMVKNPLTVIKKWEKYKKVKKIIFHYESMKDDDEIFQLVNYLKKKKFKVGIAVNPLTPVSKIIKFIPEIDLIFLLGVEPGWGNQVLESKVLNKAKRIRMQYPQLDIELDGGINIENITRVIQSGVNIIAAGTMIFSSENLDETIKEIKIKLN